MILSRKLGLTWEMTKRDLAARYRGSILGVAWSLAIPLSMLLVYSFVFGTVFKVKWGSDHSPSGFALALFAGLVVFNFFAESVQRSVGVVLGNPNLVKKVVFPVEILPLTVVLSALIQACISLAVLLVALLVVNRHMDWTVLLIPAVMGPVVLLSIGFAYAVSALSVFIRDIGQGVPILVAAAMFLSPVFYPLAAIPEAYRSFAQMSPIAGAVEGMRRVTLEGIMPDWQGLAASALVGAIACGCGYAIFRGVRKGFADVL